MIDFLITQFSECLRFPVVHPSAPLFSPAPWPAVTTVEHRPVAEQHQHGSHWQDRIQLRPPAEAGPAPDRNDGKWSAPNGNYKEDPGGQRDQSHLPAELSVHIGEGPGGVHQVFVKMWLLPWLFKLARVVDFTVFLLKRNVPGAPISFTGFPISLLFIFPKRRKAGWTNKYSNKTEPR